jgi:hypothetical protein
VATRVVNIKIGPGHKNLTCEPIVLHAKKLDSIIFYSNDGPFTFIAKGVSPLDKVDIRSQEVRVPQKLNRNLPTNRRMPTTAKVQIAMANISGNAINGVYSFACAIYDPKTKEIYVDAGCPSFIIDPGTQG